MDAQDTEIAGLREAWAQGQDARQAVSNELEARTQELLERNTELAEALSSREDLARRLDHERRVAVAARESLEAAQARIAELGAQREGTTARSEMLEAALSEAKSRSEEARADLEHSQGVAGELRASLTERDDQIRSLTAVVEREQRAREGDGEHWLARTEELQATIIHCREREARLTKEKRASAEEATQLRQELHQALQRLTSEGSGDPAGSDG